MYSYMQYRAKFQLLRMLNHEEHFKALFTWEQVVPGTRITLLPESPWARQLIQTFLYKSKRAFTWQITTCLGEEGDPGPRDDSFPHEQDLRRRLRLLFKTRWLRGGYWLATRWLRSGYAVATRWLRSGYGVGTRWLRGGYGVVTRWLRGGYGVATGWLRGGYGVATGWLRGGYAVATGWLRSGYGVATRWLRGGYAVATQWLRGGYGVATRWLRGGYAVATGWLRGGYAVATGWLRGGYGVATGWLRSGYGVATRWLRGGYGVATQWLRGGYAVATGWLRGGYGVATQWQKQKRWKRPARYWSHQFSSSRFSRSSSVPAGIGRQRKPRKEETSRNVSLCSKVPCHLIKVSQLSFPALVPPMRARGGLERASPTGPVFAGPFPRPGQQWTSSLRPSSWATRTFFYSPPVSVLASFSGLG